MPGAMIRVCKEESFHQRQGYGKSLMGRCQGSEKDRREMAQDALNRWVVAIADDCSAPPTPTAPFDQVDEMEDQALLSMTNSRQKNFSSPPTVPQACRYLGRHRCLIPISNGTEETKLYDHGEIDWAEFRPVRSKATALMNRDRLGDPEQGLGTMAPGVREAALGPRQKKRRQT